MYYGYKLWYKCKYNIEDDDDNTWGTTNTPWPYFSENDETRNKWHKWSASSACTVEFLLRISSRFITYVTLDIKHQTGQKKNDGARPYNLSFSISRSARIPAESLLKAESHYTSRFRSVAERHRSVKFSHV